MDLTRRWHNEGGVPQWRPLTKTGTFSWPSPSPFLYFGFIIVVLGAHELIRIARVRSQRFGITDRRAIFLGRKARSNPSNDRGS